MSNSNNQLDLFHGVVLTQDQENEVKNWVVSQAKKVSDRQDEVNRIMLMLDEAGFVQGQDYQSNFEMEEVTREREFGYSYNKTNYEHEVTYLSCNGGVHLLVSSIHEGKIKIYKAGVSKDGNKLMCTSVTEQYRYYKQS